MKILKLNVVILIIVLMIVLKRYICMDFLTLQNKRMQLVFIKYVTKSGNIGVTLVSSNSRVVPLKKKNNMPRLELLGNLIASRGKSKVRQIRQLPKMNFEDNHSLSYDLKARSIGFLHG